MTGAVADAFDRLPGESGKPVRALALRVAAAIDDESAAKPELPYHNRYHVAETVLAMSVLCDAALELSLISPRAAGLGVAAMVGHDWGHDGTQDSAGRLEAEAAAAMRAATHALPAAQRQVIGEIIIRTNPALLAETAARAAGRLPAGPLGVETDRLCRLANEADLFASLLPSRTHAQADSLVREWRLQGPIGAKCAADIAGYAGHLALLRRYADFSDSAVHLGLAANCHRQIDAFARVAILQGAGFTPESGAAFLDQMSHGEAPRIYQESLTRLGG